MVFISRSNGNAFLWKSGRMYVQRLLYERADLPPTMSKVWPVLMVSSWTHRQLGKMPFRHRVLRASLCSVFPLPWSVDSSQHLHLMNILASSLQAGHGQSLGVEQCEVFAHCRIVGSLV